MNDLSGSAAASDSRRCCDPIPSPIPCLLPPLFLSGLAVSVFILVVVRNAFSLAFLLALAALVLGFVLWNLYKFRANGALLLFLDRMPASDLGGARDGQIVKITGADSHGPNTWETKWCAGDRVGTGRLSNEMVKFASCGDLALESSYEKIERCIYSSTLLYEYRGFGSRTTAANSLCFRWNLTYVERCIADFYVTDVKSGTRVLVKAGSDSKINPVVTESLIVNTTTKNRELSSTLTKWLVERNLSAEPRLLRLKEGYIKEGSSLTVMGMLSRKSGVLTIIPLPEPITTGCILRKFLLPIDIDGLVLRYHRDDSAVTSACTDQIT